MKYYVKFILLLLFALIFLNNNLSLCFKLRDASSKTDEPDSKYESKSEIGGRDRQSGPQFKKIVKIIHVNEDGTETEEKLAINFEKVHKSDYQKPTESKRKRIVIEKLSETPVEEEEIEEKSSFSLLSLFNVFGFGKSDESEHKEDEKEILLSSESEPSETWFQSFLKRFAKTEEPAPTPVVEDWKSYLNRWPFNLFLDFIYYESSDSEIEEDDKIKQEQSKTNKEEAPLGEAEFEKLLHYLPNFVIHTDEVINAECRRQIQIFHHQLRGHKLWTLHMLDSIGKIPSGILRGNIKQYGDFDQCVNIRTAVKVLEDQSVRIKGKYCLVHLDIKVVSPDLKVPVHYLHGRNMLKSNLDNPAHFIPRYTVGNLGICIPHSCTPQDALQMVKTIFSAYNTSGINFHIQISEEDCFVKRNQSISYLVSNSFKLQMTLSFYGFFISLVICGTLMDCWPTIAKYSSEFLSKQLKITEESVDNKVDEKENIKTDSQDDSHQEPIEKSNGIYNTSSEVILSFSLQRNIRKLLTKEPKEDILLLDFLKVVSTLCSYAFLKFLMIGHLSIINRDKLVRVMSHPFSTWLRTPLLYLDIFLLISGILSSYRIPENIKTNFKTVTFRILGGKVMRYAPLTIAVVLFQIWIVPHLGSGPLWGNIVKHNSDICSDNFWRNLFFTQNFINMEEACLPFTIQYAVDFQLFLLAPLLVWLYYRDQDLGLIVFGSLQAVSVSLRFSRTNQDRLSAIIFHGMNVSQFYRAANTLYASALYRLTPFLFGVGTGVFLKNYDSKPSLPKGVLACGWLISLWFLLWCFWYPLTGSQIDFIYNPNDAAVYSSWAPILLSLALAWIISITHTHGLDKPFCAIFTSRPIVVLSKISFPMQIVSFVAILLFTAQTKEPQQFSLSYLFNPTEIIFIVICSTILTLVFDLPIQTIRKIIFIQKLTADTDNAEIEENTNTLVTELSEHESIEEHNREEIERDDGDEDEHYNQFLDDEDIGKSDLGDLKEDMLIGNPQEDVLYFIPRRTILNSKSFNDDPGFDWNHMEEHADESWQNESDLGEQLSPEFEKIVEEPEEDAEDEEVENGEKGKVDTHAEWRF